MPRNRKTTSKRRPKARTSRRPARRANPAPAYKGDQTYRHRFQAVYHAVAAAAGGFVESVNFGVIDDFSVLAAQWAIWRIRSFTVKIMPSTSVAGAYSARPFEPIDGTPVTPTTLASIMDGGGVMRPCNNINPAGITHLRWVSKQLNSDTFTPTTSTTNSNFGDPGFMFYTTGLGSEFYIEVNIDFEFREATQYATITREREIIFGVPVDTASQEALEDDFEKLEIKSTPRASVNIATPKNGQTQHAALFMRSIKRP